ncbi:MAG TPA: ATP synthase F1 subunit gamma [Candidatus Paceibacterota bacterium]|nr:ATP synthase F1 subunit gamma [Candidatus Paceibacterota bacterium]
MESGQSLKRRMKSVQNIGQITKAMELVSATKMRRSQELALHSRPYAYTALRLLGILSSLKDVPTPVLFEKREVQRTAFLLMMSDRGLAGSFNGAVVREFERYMKANKIDILDPRYSFIAIGQKAKSYFERRRARVIASFTRVSDASSILDAEPIADFLIEGYARHDFDGVIAFFTTFVTALRQDPVVRELLPVSFEAIRQSVEETIPRAGRYADYAKSEAFMDGREKEYIIEPSPKEVLDELAPKLLKIRLYHAILEANASEHSARRVAMKNASDNASELSETLTMVYNKSRQAAITAQIIEITSGAESLQ